MGTQETLSMAQLVQVSVESDHQNNHNNSNNSNKKNHFENKRNANKKKKGSTATREEDDTTYPHFCTATMDTNSPSSPTLLATKQNQLIGWGVYNPNSLYRVRILCHAQVDSVLTKTLQSLQQPRTGNQSSNDNDSNNNNNISSMVSSSNNSVLQMLSTIIRYKLQCAIQTRQALGLPSSQTDTFRLVNGEGDGLSGLAMDVLGNQVVVIMSSAAWCQVYQEEITTIVEQEFKAWWWKKRQEEEDKEQQQEQPEHDNDIMVVWKTTSSRLKQDGWEHSEKVQDNNDSDNDNDQDVYKTNTNHVDTNTAIVIQESGVLYRTYPFRDGQKTGVYCDQRDNKYHLATLCQNKTVLDLCCYHGGFSLTAKLLGGAMHCTGVDSSQQAIDICRDNAQLNGLTVPQDVDFCCDDVANFMKLAASDPSKHWDVIVLDPPKLAPTTSSLERAARKYYSLNRDALQLINPTRGGLFLTCTCSAAMTQREGGAFFLETIQQAALVAGRRITLLRTSGAAACHTQSPVSYPAGVYLTTALFHVSGKE